MKKLIGIVLKQYHVGQLPGAIKAMFSLTLNYVGYINFGLICAVAYNTTLREPLQQYFPWVTFPIFIGVLVIVIISAMLFEYKVMMPSEIAFRNRQVWRHYHPMKEKIEKIMDKLEDLEKMIGEQ